MNATRSHNRESAVSRGRKPRHGKGELMTTNQLTAELFKALIAGTVH
jgi:hypothetical protein